MREKLAKLSHEQWSGWVDYMFGKCIPYELGKVQAEKGALIIPKWAVDRWKRQAKTPYSNLTLAEMDSDRKEADRFLDLLDPEPTEFEKSPMLSECWLIHPIDDDDCIQCPQVFECREVRSEIYRLTAENKILEGYRKVHESELGVCEQHCDVVADLQAEIDKLKELETKAIDGCIRYRDKLKVKDDYLNIILRNIKNGTVTTHWIEQFIEQVLKGDQDGKTDQNS